MRPLVCGVSCAVQQPSDLGRGQYEPECQANMSGLEPESHSSHRWSLSRERLEQGDALRRFIGQHVPKGRG